MKLRPIYCILVLFILISVACGGAKSTAALTAFPTEIVTPTPAPPTPDPTQIAQAEKHVATGLKLRDQDKLEDAIIEYDRAIELNPAYAEAYNFRGNSYFELGDVERAVQDYDAAIAINGHYTQAYNHRGIAFARLDQLDQAIEDYTQAVLYFLDYAERGPSTPSVAEGVVYVNYQGRFGVQALDAATGATLELYELSDEVLTPVVSDGMVYVGSSDWDLHALDAATGEIMWRYRTSNEAYPAAIADGVVYSVTIEGYLYALDAKTGKGFWRYDIGRKEGGSSSEVRNISSIAVGDGLVYVGSTSGEVYALRDLPVR